MTTPLRSDQLKAMVEDSRRRTLELVLDLDRQQLLGAKLDIVNPLLWEIGHVAWFHERWILRHLDGRTPLRPDADALYDSMAVPHDTRWDLALPSLADTLAYMEGVQLAILARLTGEFASASESYFYQLTTYHEDMHGEAFTYTRQTHGFATPRLAAAPATPPAEWRAGPLAGDVSVPGGTFWLGASAADPFVFDNEKWAHPVEVAPFRIARAPVTNAELAAFVAAGGYRERRFWSEAGWRWREQAGAGHPVYWVRADGRWRERRFDGTFELAPHAPVIHVNWFEAQAYCEWAGRRLPSELEWEVAACGEPDSGGRQLAARKRRFPWGDEPPGPEHANLDGRALGTIDVAALPAGDSACGCRQLIGNVWEWTASTFLPYPGFVPDPYEAYSEPWFGTRKVLRGGAWATRGRMLRNTWRNFFTPDRRDVFAGFRTCPC